MAAADACPPAERMQGIVDGTISATDRASLAQHAETCDSCRAVLVELIRSASRDALLTDRTASDGGAGASSLATEATVESDRGTGVVMEVALGTVIDRYVIDRRLGAGAMGVVYAAHDPELDRQVAIKLLRSEGDDDELRGRLYREAQALARVAHPNVVTVHDVGTHDGRVFLAMEMVRGTTLRGWLEERRPWPEIVAMLVAAGKGLAAAHAAGLVHRDFKPDNVLVGEDGRARVTDFGLARASGVVSADVGSRTGSPAVGSPLTDALTETGSLLGTPLYAAPEQLAGERAGPLADQFGFCVTAYEALYGVRPFIATSLDQLRKKIADGEMTPPPASRAVPGRIHRALLRGMAVAPEARFPTMEALLAELAPPPRRRWPWIVAAAAAAVVPVAVILALPGTEQPARCRSADERLAGVWDATRRAAITRTFAPLTGYTGAGATLIEHLDGYATRWRAGWNQACAAPEQSQVMFDLRIACLDRRRAELASIAGAAATIDRSTAENAIGLVQGLGPIEDCADTTALGKVAGPTPARRAAVSRIEQALLAGRTAGSLSQLDASRAVIEPAVAEARALGYQPLVASALLALARLERRTDRLKEAEVAARAATSTAMIVDDQITLGAAFLELGIIRNEQGNMTGAEEALDHAQAIVPRLGTSALATYLEQAWADLRLRQARHDEVLAHMAAVIATLEAEKPVDLARLGDALVYRGAVLDRAGRPKEAAPVLEHALDVLREAVGADHPKVAAAQHYLAINRASFGRYAEALALVEKAYEAVVAATGPDYSQALLIEDTLAAIANELGDHDRALAHYDHIIAINKKIDPRSLDIVMTQLSHAGVLIRAGRLDAALEELVGARAVIAASPEMGEASIQMSVSHLPFGEVQLRQGKLDLAWAAFDRAHAALEAALGPDHSFVAVARAGRGRVRVAQGRLADALPDLKAAVANLEHQGMPYETAQTRLALAEAMWRTGDKPAARALAVAAIADLDALAPKAGPDLRVRIAAWQAGHR